MSYQLQVPPPFQFFDHTTSDLGAGIIRHRAPHNACRAPCKLQTISANAKQRQPTVIVVRCGSNAKYRQFQCRRALIGLASGAIFALAATSATISTVLLSVPSWRDIHFNPESCRQRCAARRRILDIHFESIVTDKSGRRHIGNVAPVGLLLGHTKNTM